MTEYLWTYSVDGTDFDAEFATAKEAIDAANEAFEQQICEEMEPENGQKFDQDIEIVMFSYYPSGERFEHQRMPAKAHYEHYHGDHAEHFNQKDYF